MIEIYSLESDKPIAFIAQPCRHRDVVPVESGGDVVAYLCRTCDAQLPEEWRP